MGVVIVDFYHSLNLKRKIIMSNRLMKASCLLLTVSPFTVSSDENPAFNAGTSELTLPLVFLEAGDSVSAYSDVQVQLDGYSVLGAASVPNTFSDQVVQGALIYSKYWEISAGGDGVKPEHAD